MKFRNRKIQGTTTVPESQYVFVRGNSRGQLIRIELDDIVYIEALANHVKIFTHNQKYVPYLTMKELEFKLTAFNFVRIHKSHMINIDKIIEKLLSVKGSKPGKQVNLLENEIAFVVNKAREVFISQPILLELEAPLKICGRLCENDLLIC